MMEPTSLLVWGGLAALLLIAFGYTVWRKLSAMNKGNFRLHYEEDDSVTVLPDPPKEKDEQETNPSHPAG